MKKSAARKRSERQGILVEAEAVRRAEAESAADAEKRAQQQKKAAKRREKEDQAYIAAFAKAIAQQFPGCPKEDAQEIASMPVRSIRAASADLPPPSSWILPPFAWPLSPTSATSTRSTTSCWRGTMTGRGPVARCNRQSRRCCASGRATDNGGTVTGFDGVRTSACWPI